MYTGNLRYQYASLSIAEKIIAINVVIFLLTTITTYLFRLPADVVSQYFELPKDFFAFLKQPWSIVTYSFFHGGLGHIFWNMLTLFYMGRIFLNLFNPQRFINVYFMGVILGGIFFMLSYNIFPALMGTNSVLIGASAGVTAILIFVCTYIPNQEVRLAFFNVKLMYIGLFWVGVNLVQIPMGVNVGGLMAHLGGALLGYLYAKQLQKGRDIGDGFSSFWQGIINLFKKREKKSPLKTVYKNKTTAKEDPTYKKEVHQRKIDEILDKISKAGYESLSKAEKDYLFKAGKENN